METKNLTSRLGQTDKQPGRKEASVRQLQAVRLNRYTKNLNALLKGKEQNAPD